MPQVPHTSLVAASPAFLAIRRGATVCAVAIALAVIVQALIFACVHFTQIRFDSPNDSRAVEKTTLAVVESQPRKRIDPASFDKDAPAPELKPGRTDAVMRCFSNLASAIGTIASAVFVVQCWAAVAIGAGAGVVGMQRTVRAATIATVLFAASAPWTTTLAATPSWGVFCGYQTLVDASAATAAGQRSEFAVIAIHGLLPMAFLAGVVWAGYALRVGISAGIVRHEIDPLVEAEIASVKEHGTGSLYAVRSAGDLNRAMAAAPVTPIRIAGDNEADRAIAELEKLAGRRKTPENPGSTPLRPTGTEPLRRPI